MKPVEHRSYNASSEDADDYGSSAFWQAEAVRDALFLATGKNCADLRGVTFTVTVSADGHGVTITPQEQGDAAAQQEVRESGQTITVPRPTVPYGPRDVPTDEADAHYLRHAARNIRFSRCMGSNLTNTVTGLLEDAAQAIEAASKEPDEPGSEPAWWKA